MSDEGPSEVDAPSRLLMVVIILAMFLAIGLMAFLYQPRPAESICANTEARCGDKPDASMQ